MKAQHTKVSNQRCCRDLHLQLVEVKKKNDKEKIYIYNKRLIYCFATCKYQTNFKRFLCTIPSHLFTDRRTLTHKFFMEIVQCTSKVNSFPKWNQFYCHTNKMNEHWYPWIIVVAEEHFWFGSCIQCDINQTMTIFFLSNLLYINVISVLLIVCGL